MMLSITLFGILPQVKLLFYERHLLALKACILKEEYKKNHQFKLTELSYCYYISSSCRALLPWGRLQECNVLLKPERAMNKKEDFFQ